MIVKEHTRNQKRMYRIHKQEEKIHNLELLIGTLQQENKQLKELIDTILNWNIFKNECPMNFGYDEETNEDKAQDVFYKDDDYCENNCNDDYTKCWLKYFKRMQELEEGKELNKKYLNAVADYETTMSELQELKKQIEEYQKALDDTMSEKMDLEEENQKYKEVIDKAINDLDIIIDIVREKPFGDRWIINRLEANKNILKEVE